MVQFNISNKLYQFGFNVLVVDDDCAHLSALGEALTKFGYQVVKLQNPEHALAILKRKKRFDIIVCGISISEIGAFNLIRTAEVEFNIPVILMVSNLSNEVAFEGILSGAAQCVAKLPVLDTQVLQNIWQHVVIRRRNEFFSCVYLPQMEPSSKVSPWKVVGETVSPTGYRGGPDYSNPKVNLKIREESGEGFDHDHQDISKKGRFIWTDEYHQIFLDVIKDITLKMEKIVPKRIFNYMKNRGVPHITRENIASHLQKHRSNIKKLYNNGIDKSCDFPNSDVTKDLKLGKSCPSDDDQTLNKTQNLASQDLSKQEQETPPTQPSNETLLFDQTMQDIDWNTLEVIIPTCFKNNSTIWSNMNEDSLEDHKIPAWDMEISDQPQQVGQESNINNEEPDPSILSVNQIFDTNYGNIIGPHHDHPLMTDFNQNLKNGLLNEYVYNSQNFESFENLTEDGFQALRGVERLNSNKQVVIK